MLGSMFGKSFSSAKCKTLLRLAISRIKLLRNKREMQLKQMRRELGQLLQTKQDLTARIRVEHVFREQNIQAAYDIIELFSELLVVRLPIIESQRQCPIDLREAIASLIFAAPRCADLPELQQISRLFAVKYGKDFVAAANELRPDCGVNRLVIEKLSVRAPSGEVRLRLMKEIAEEQGVDWDASAPEYELQRPPEDLLDTQVKGLTSTDSGNGATFFKGHSQLPATPQDDDRQHRAPPDMGKEESYKEAVKAARAAAFSAERAATAAIKIASLAKGNLTRMPSKVSKRSSTSESSSASDEEDDDYRKERPAHNGSQNEYFNIQMDTFDALVAPTKPDSSYGRGCVTSKQPDSFHDHGHVTSKEPDSFHGCGYVTTGKYNSYHGHATSKLPNSVHSHVHVPTGNPNSYHGHVTTTDAAPVFDDYPEDNARCSWVRSNAGRKQTAVKEFTSDEDQSDSTDGSASPPLHRGGNGKLKDEEGNNVHDYVRHLSKPNGKGKDGEGDTHNYARQLSKPKRVSFHGTGDRSQPPQRPPPTPYLAHDDEQLVAPPYSDHMFIPNSLSTTICLPGLKL